MASVRKREWEHKGEKKAAWVVSYTDPSGKRRLKTFDFKRDADKYRLQVETEIEGGIHVAPAASKSVAEAVGFFIADCERRHRLGENMTGETLSNIRVLLRHVEKTFGAKKLTALEGLQIRDFMHTLQETYARRTVAGIISRFSNVLDFSVQRKWLKRNIISDEKITVARKPKVRKSIPSKPQLRALLEVAFDPSSCATLQGFVMRRAFVCLGLFGGLRIGEICGLQWEDVDFGAGVIRIRHSLSYYDGLKVPKTPSGVRTVPIAEEVKRVLLDVLRFSNIRDDAVEFRKTTAIANDRKLDQSAISARVHRVWGREPTADAYEMRKGHVLKGTRLPYLRPMVIRQSMWEPMCKQAGLVDEDGKVLFTPHDLRHAAASLFIEAGLPAMHLKAVIGHASVSTTYDIYGHLFPDDERSYSIVRGATTSLAATRERQDGVTA